MQEQTQNITNQNCPFYHAPLELKRRLKGVLVRHEGEKQFPYLDTTNNITIGIGRNLSTRGLLISEIDYMCDNDMDYFYGKLASHFDWFNYLNDDRKIALISMCFMGFQNFLTFKKMISALSRADYAMAAIEVMDSKYSTQVGMRAEEIAKVLRTGSF